MEEHHFSNENSGTVPNGLAVDIPTSINKSEGLGEGFSATLGNIPGTEVHGTSKCDPSGSISVLEQSQLSFLRMACVLNG